MELYLYFCLSLFILSVGGAFYSDVFNGPHATFGYLLKDRIFWLFTILFCMPVLNLVVAVCYAGGYLAGYSEGWD